MLKKNEVTKIPCIKHPEEMMFSAYNQMPPKKKKDVVRLGCRQCYPQGYKLWAVPGYYYQKFAPLAVVAVAEEVVDLGDIEFDNDVSEMIEERISAVETSSEPVRRRRGRPPGSKNKKTLAKVETPPNEPPVKRGRGRPKGSKNKPKV